MTRENDDYEIHSDLTRMHLARMDLAATSVEVVLFDFDGVIRHWRNELVDALERRAGLPSGVILSTAQQVPEDELGVLGQMSFDDWCRATATALEPAAGRHAVDVVAEWSRYRATSMTAWSVSSRVRRPPPAPVCCPMPTTASVENIVRSRTPARHGRLFALQQDR